MIEEESSSLTLRPVEKEIIKKYMIEVAQPGEKEFLMLSTKRMLLQ